MIEATLEDLMDATGATLLRGDPTSRFRGVSTDTRSLRGGELFLALSGPNFDGNQFASRALDEGAAALLLRGEGDDVMTLIDPPAITSTRRTERQLPPPGVLVHPEPRRAMASLATWHRERLDIPVVGITGSCGKTTTKNILMELLRDHLGVTGSPASFNNDIGVPHTLLRAGAEHELLVCEIGTSGPGEIERLCEVARPSAGIITMIGSAHLEELGSLEGVAREKGQLAAAIPADGFIVLNADCPFTPLLRSMTRARVITFSLEGRGDLNATDPWFHAGGTTFKLGELEVTSPLLGLHTVQNLLAALAACVGLGHELADVLPAVTRLKSEKRRMERIELPGGITLFDDSYNANPDSARASVRVLTGVHGHARRVLVLGDMLELGELSAELHHEVGRLAAEAGVDQLWLVGDLTRATAAGALEAGLPADRVLHWPDRTAACEAITSLLHDGDVVLVKASRGSGLDRLVTHITEHLTPGRGDAAGAVR